MRFNFFPLRVVKKIQYLFWFVLNLLVCVLALTCVAIRGQLHGVSSLLPFLRGFQGLNKEFRMVWQVPLPTNPPQPPSHTPVSSVNETGLAKTLARESLLQFS